ncbi:MAG: SGNH/GDSL hydrolase family protein [Acetobacteraceae bacterium]|nr:SGNH/GDSL hydrolase family protein [Acetobacteraceae bacterium]
MTSHWVGTWAATPAPADGVALSSPTIRMFPRISIGGEMIRIRLSNAAGKGDLVIAATQVALRAPGAAIQPGSDRAVTFNGSGAVKISGGAFVISDPVALRVAPLDDLAVSIHIPNDIPASFGVTGRYSRQLNYLSPPGDFTSHEVMHTSRMVDDWFFLCGIDVEASPDVGGIVALGDSITDGNISTYDAFARWPDQLARRLVARGGKKFGVMNQGLGGNRILHDIRGDSGVKRFDRDVLAQPGVTHAIVVLGINDIRNRRGLAEEVVTAPEMIAGLRQMALRAHDHGIKIFGGTLTPFENETFMLGAYTLEGEAKRLAVNEWIRSSGAFDAAIDFDAGLRDPDHHARMLPIYDNGDHLHPGDVGYNRMGDLIDLSLFD